MSSLDLYFIIIFYYYYYFYKKNLKEKTSALAEIILLSANFFDLIADDNTVATSLLRTMSLINTKKS